MNIPVTSVAATLKMFVRTSPALFSKKQIKKLIKIFLLPDQTTRLVGGYENISGQKDDARQLRQPEARILKFIIQHLVNVAGNRAVNKMNSKKLAICWFPSLLPMDFADINRYYEAQPHQEGLVQTMIDQFAFLFLGKNEIVGPNGVEFVTVPEPAANLPNQEKKRSFLNRIFFYSESEFKERIMKKGKTVHVQINNQETTM